MSSKTMTFVWDVAQAVNLVVPTLTSDYTITNKPTDQRFGRHKIFIHAIYVALIRAYNPVVGRLDEALFKGCLVEANREGWLCLARADLVGAMDPDMVAASEIKDMGATFHFVLDPDAYKPRNL